ncbi:NADP-dependent 3-hydroxy acid dehydrogenase YdfG [Tamaricihabitans halophyticus]|uniref:NADP-dependent 3-hydroxy acid dehydrogenase YdfG n=1 Tax=Tamaricihabitans halophyticus TaxID=1262583 RepID=A0A4V2SUD6_9PSEU|nr:short-chain dehydrogenase/reductase [Tamaricihabitans halophyticus]TCP54146.1 NADP-dependent 3-hydroxy acid dehydrogenase YdfG [Tamaricihabitans halophyticus]
MRSPFRLPRRTPSMAGKVVLLTGAARGIGAELAKRLAADGARLALVGLEGEQLRAVAKQCGAEAAAWEADVTSWSELEAAVEAAVARFGRLDVVVANAGVAATGFVRSIDPAAFERTVEIDLLGVWRTFRVALPHVIEARGYLLAISSLAAIAHAPGMAPYAAAKAGVEAFANSLRAEVRHLGVAVGVAHPSWIRTDLVTGADEHPVFGRLRAAMPGPLGKTHPVSAVVDDLARGIRHRARAVHTPGIVGVLKLIRSTLPAIIELGSRPLIPRADREALADIATRGAAASQPVGPGGAAGMGSDRNT